MEFDAAAPAPATDEAMAPVAETTSEPSESDNLSAIYDKLTTEEPETTEEPVAEPAPVVEPVPEAPSDLPLAIKGKWAEMPAEVRDAVAESHRGMSQKLAEQGRLIQGIAPVRDALSAAAKDIPALMNMRPDQVAVEIMELAKISQQFEMQPVETLIGLMRQHGVEDRVRAALGAAPAQQGQAEFTGAMQEIARLKQQLSRVADPAYLQEQIAASMTQERVLTDVQTFATGKEHWATLESHLPTFIPLARQTLNEGASAQDVLSQAYDMAVSAFGLKKTPQPAVEATAVANPEKAEAAKLAKSVNITSRPDGRQREMSDDERLAAAYDRAARK